MGSARLADKAPTLLERSVARQRGRARDDAKVKKSVALWDIRMHAGVQRRAEAPGSAAMRPAVDQLLMRPQVWFWPGSVPVAICECRHASNVGQQATHRV